MVLDRDVGLYCHRQMAISPSPLVYCHASYIPERPFGSKVITQTYKHTHRTDRCTWTTKMVNDNISERVI